MAHEGSVMAAFQEGETRFLFARYRSGEPGLYELVNGTAVIVRKYVKSELFCPVPDCPTPEINTVNRKKYQQHFRHITISSAHAPESLFHIEGKAQIAKWVRAKYPDAVVVEEQASNAKHDRIADVMVTLADGQRIAIEIQYAALRPDDWQVRHDSYLEQGIRDIWLFGHQGSQLKAGKLANQVKLNPTHEAVAAAGMPILWFNPEKLQVASVTTDGSRDFRTVRMAATSGLGNMTVETIDLFSLTFEEGLSHERLAIMLKAAAEWEAGKAAWEAAKAAHLAAEAAEREKRVEQKRLEDLRRAEVNANRDRLAVDWLTSDDGKAILALFDGQVPGYLNMDTPGVDLPISSVIWQSHLYLTFIKPLVPNYQLKHLELGPAVIAKFELEIAPAIALNITIAWCERLQRSGVLDPGPSPWGAQYDVDKYRKATPKPASRPSDTSRLVDVPASPGLSFENTVRAAHEAAAVEAARPKLSATHCRTCGGKIDALLGTASNYHLMCDPNRPRRRRRY